MSMSAAARKKKASTPSALDAAAAAPARTLGRGGFSAPTALSLGRGGGSAMARSLWTWRQQKKKVTRPTTGAWFDAADSDPSSPVSWDKDPRPSGGFMSYFENQPHNFHLVGAPIHNSPLNRPLSTNNDASSQPEVEILLDNDNVRTEKRILWTEEEDLRLMSAWIEHSTDSTCGADKGGNQYWGEVVKSYNKTTPPLRKRNLKQCKDRWHKINRWTDLFEYAYVKARRVFTSGYSDQTWTDAAHKFYVEDNKVTKLGPFVGIEVWKICREVSKWKTYNEELRNARKRKSFHLEEERDQENDESLEEMLNRPMGQKAAKKTALAAKGKSKGSSSEDNGNSKESAIDLDKLDKFQEETNANRMKILDRYSRSYHPRSLRPQNLPTLSHKRPKRERCLRKNQR
ncbi:unnamed protein product [Miscanthus lutarioriparius]|uniref:Myb-like domain-containing protein n=1 Tax=Miscanthus lutarioriparius TaxID=422564 RepID=A0A811P3J2_9POAL|nr:unnamed protein product [Miscanthus lutarioriparius]